MSERVQLDEIPEVVSPFARVIDGPPSLINQNRLDDLQQLYRARASSAFRINTYDAGQQAAPLFHLPFRLALGIHGSVKDELDPEVVEATFSTYESISPLFLTGDGYPHRKRMRNRAESAICGAIIEAAADRRYTHQVTQAFEFARFDYDLISHKAGRVVEKAIELVSRG